MKEAWQQQFRVRFRIIFRQPSQLLSLLFLNSLRRLIQVKHAVKTCGQKDILDNFSSTARGDELVKTSLILDDHLLHPKPDHNAEGKYLGVSSF
jgi:hypothetical protein